MCPPSGEIYSCNLAKIQKSCTQLQAGDNNVGKRHNDKNKERCRSSCIILYKTAIIPNVSDIINFSSAIIQRRIAPGRLVVIDHSYH